MSELWVGKVYVPSSIKHHSNRLTAYSRSIADCQRSAITQDELVTFTWTFCFKHSADPLSAAGQGQEYRWRFCRSKQHRLGTFVQLPPGINFNSAFVEAVAEAVVAAATAVVQV
ncbi:hypothetical protein HaLaN_05923 [Haematococcus lacustris]|uniref:Uncharacterized protein n=1 Tax=Haematococcus lacustris TaxID=44745 RepID=A0A699YUD3_HAELA|nr:hypothetical protein HaLaN_05923 [Haematococcus lacustris]